MKTLHQRNIDVAFNMYVVWRQDRSDIIPHGNMLINFRQFVSCRYIISPWVITTTARRLNRQTIHLSQKNSLCEICCRTLQGSAHEFYIEMQLGQICKQEGWILKKSPCTIVLMLLVFERGLQIDEFQLKTNDIENYYTM